jgi:hypothetical protein
VKLPIDDYIRENRGTYTDDAIREQLLRAGYPHGAIVDAFRRSGQKAELSPAARRSWLLFLGYAVGLFVVVFLVFAYLSDMQERTYGVGRVVFAVAMLIGLTLAVLLVRRSRAFALGLSSGVATAVLVPFVIVVIIAGLCVVSTNPVFFFPGPGTYR